MISSLLYVENKKTDYSVILIRATSLDDLLAQLTKPPAGCAIAFEKLLSLYNTKYSFPNMSHFRLGPNMFKNISLYFIVLMKKDLIAHGIMTDIFWKESMDLPNGWQGAVRTSYEQSLSGYENKNILVGLYVRVEKQYKQQGISGKVIQIMKNIANQKKFDSLIIPLRLPTRFTEKYAKISYQKFVSLKRKDGEYLDHWLRLHTRLGGVILGVNLISHQHAMNLDDFFQQFSTKKKIKRSGYYISEKDNLFYNVYVDTKRKFALINQECIWIKHTLSEEIA